MDPFSAASGTVGIISLGLTVAQGLFQIANGIGSAGQEVRRYAQEIDTFSKLLSTVQIELDKSKLPSDDIRDSFDEILHLCERALIPLNNLQKTLKPLLDHYKSSKNKLRQLGLRIKWFFEEKEKLLFYISTLGEEHRALNTLLEILNHRQTRHLSQNTALMELRIQNSLAAMSISLKASRQDHVAFIEASPQQKNFTRTLPSSHTAIVALLEAGPEQEECEKAAQDKEEAVNTARHITTGPAGENSSGKNNTSKATASERLSKEHYEIALSIMEARTGNSVQQYGELSDSADESLSDFELGIINELVERDLSSETPESAMDMWLDIRALKRRVERIALRTQASETRSESSNKSEAKPTREDVAKEMIRKVDPKPDIDTSYTSDYTIGIICPGMLACEALRTFLDEEHPSKIAPYTLGRIGRHNIAIAPLSNGDISTHSAAVMAFKLQNTFPNIHMGLVVGPAGAIPSDSHDIRLGDVVVSYPGNAIGGVIPYDHRTNSNIGATKKMMGL
ncbi:hypothetical protein LIA77_10730 [Sarocladium implicatum]|nr:hypothetical protein LIA77_10730 [Sarocladium implicatum]